MGAVRGGLYDTHIIWQPIIRDLCCWVLWFQTTTPMTIKVIWLTINKVDFPRDHLLEQKLGALRAVYPLAHFPVLDFFPCYIKDGLKGWTSGLFGKFWVSLWVWGGGLAVGFFFNSIALRMGIFCHHMEQGESGLRWMSWTRRGDWSLWRVAWAKNFWRLEQKSDKTDSAFGYGLLFAQKFWRVILLDLYLFWDLSPKTDLSSLK